MVGYIKIGADCFSSRRFPRIRFFSFVPAILFYISSHHHISSPPIHSVLHFDTYRTPATTSSLLSCLNEVLSCSLLSALSLSSLILFVRQRERFRPSPYPSYDLTNKKATLTHAAHCLAGHVYIYIYIYIYFLFHSFNALLVPPNAARHDAAGEGQPHSGGEGVSSKTLDSMLALELTEEQLAEALPLHTIREMRHCHTKTFAAVLYRCIVEIAEMAKRKRSVNDTNQQNPSKTALKSDEVSRFHTALMILRRCTPFALEEGDVSLLPEVHPTPSTAAGPTPAADGATAARVEPPPTHKTKTAATMQFQRLFFAEGRTCDDGNPEERFPPPPAPTPTPAAPGPDPAPFWWTPFPAPGTALGTQLVWSLVECCFIRGLTLNESWRLPATNTTASSLSHIEVDTSVLWYDGVGSANPHNATSYAATAVDKNVLKTLLILLSSQVFRRPSGVTESRGAGGEPTASEPALEGSANHQALAAPASASGTPPQEAPSASSKGFLFGFRDTIFMEPLISTTTVPLMPTLGVSLLNGVVQYIPFGAVPYSSYWGLEAETEVVAGARVLVAILSYVGSPLGLTVTRPRGGGNKEQSGGEGQGSDGEVPRRAPVKVLTGPGAPRHTDPTTEQLESQQQESAGGPPAPAPPRAQFVHCLRKLFFEITMTEGKFIVEHFRHLIGLRTYAMQTYLPDSQRKIESQDELVLLLWKLLDLSPMVYQQFGYHPDALTYVVPLLHYALDVRFSTSAYLHHLQLTLFILLRLSELRPFCLQCNKVLTETIPFTFPRLPPGVTTYNEVIMIAMCLLLEMKEASVVPLLTSCSIILANMTPYVTSVGALCATRLVNVFTVVSAKFLRLPTQCNAAASPTAAHGSVALQDAYESIMLNVCEAIASLLQYNTLGSKCVVAALLQHRTTVRVLMELYVYRRLRHIRIQTALPFLIVTLDSTIAAATPLVVAGGIELPPLPAPPAASSSGAAVVEPPSAAVALTSTPALRAMEDIWRQLSATSASSDGGGSDAATSSPLSMSPVVPGRGAAPPSSYVSQNTPPIEAQIRQTEAIFQLLGPLSLVGAIPTPHRIMLKRLQTSPVIEQWTMTAFWTCLYTELPAGTLGDRESAKLLSFQS
eukprot:gene11305-7837_t